MGSFSNQHGAAIVTAVIKVVQENAKYLSEIDGAIGDGDHGINMNKAVTQAEARLAGQSVDMTNGLKTLSDIMMDDIGGSMGPLYGTFFRQMFRVSRDKAEIDAELFNQMLNRALASIKDIGSAKVGDKTMLDTLEPAVLAFEAKQKAGESFASALAAMKAAAEQGRDSTVDMVAKVGRSSRLGERSRGVLDAGATSCCLILCAMADSITELLE
ncbi:MAG: dihydroxyacetone kinase subunit DhaL [Desulfocapsaceae bacterium]|jgi:dihydroxyacetone kinase-like protein|nr:dihydroxyacetone kinase subunit DhaL [Desulfocapsaceae bacterium]